MRSRSATTVMLAIVCRWIGMTGDDRPGVKELGVTGRTSLVKRVIHTPCAQAEWLIWGGYSIRTVRASQAQNSLPTQRSALPERRFMWHRVARFDDVSQAPTLHSLPH